MNKSAILLLVIFMSFTVLSCSDDIVKSAATPAPTIVGVWKTSGLGVVTDTKIVEATITDISKIDTKGGTSLAAITFDFKADGTCITPGTGGGSATDAGKYTLSADKKNITITSNTAKDSKGNLTVQTFELVALTDSDLRLGISTLVKKDSKGLFIVDLLSADFATYLFGVYVFSARGLNAEAELLAAKSLQTTYNLKK